MLDDLRVVFKRPSSGDWITDMDGLHRALCNSGVKKYVNLPGGCTEFEAVFTVNQPDEGGYEVRPGGLDIIDTPDFYSEIVRLLDGIHRNGYRWMHVEFES